MPRDFSWSKPHDDCNVPINQLYLKRIWKTPNITVISVCIKYLRKGARQERERKCVCAGGIEGIWNQTPNVSVLFQRLLTVFSRVTSAGTRWLAETRVSILYQPIDYSLKGVADPPPYVCVCIYLWVAISSLSFFIILPWGKIPWQGGDKAGAQRVWYCLTLWVQSAWWFCIVL